MMRRIHLRRFRYLNDSFRTDRMLPNQTGKLMLDISLYEKNLNSSFPPTISRTLKDDACNNICAGTILFDRGRWLIWITPHSADSLSHVSIDKILLGIELIKYLHVRRELLSCPREGRCHRRVAMLQRMVKRRPTCRSYVDGNRKCAVQAPPAVRPVLRYFCPDR